MALQGVLEIAEEGFDIKDCPDENKAFSSKFPTMKTFMVEVLEPTDVIDHDLGYQPIYLYCSYLTDKPLLVGLIGQNTLDFGAQIDVNENDIRSYTTSGFSADALVYVFIEELINSWQNDQF